MKTNKAICSPDFYENVGFNTIRTWLGEHCLCSINEGYFHELEPLSSKVEIEQSQSFSDELLASFQRNSPVPLETIPDITEIFSIIEISGALLNSDQLFYHRCYQKQFLHLPGCYIFYLKPYSEHRCLLDHLRP